MVRISKRELSDVVWISGKSPRLNSWSEKKKKEKEKKEKTVRGVSLQERRRENQLDYDGIRREELGRGSG